MIVSQLPQSCSWLVSYQSTSQCTLAGKSLKGTPATTTNRNSESWLKEIAGEGEIWKRHVCLRASLPTKTRHLLIEARLMMGENVLGMNIRLEMPKRRLAEISCRLGWGEATGTWIYLYVVPSMLKGRIWGLSSLGIFCRSRRFGCFMEVLDRDNWPRERGDKAMSWSTGIWILIPLVYILGKAV